jgi:hypothetical protein
VDLLRTCRLQERQTHDHAKERGKLPSHVNPRQPIIHPSTTKSAAY